MSTATTLRTRHKCSRCGTADAYQGYSRDECINPKCPLYSVAWATNTPAKPTGGLATAPWDPRRPYHTSNEFWAIQIDTGQVRAFRKVGAVWEHLTLRKTWGGPRVSGTYRTQVKRIITANYHIMNTGPHAALAWTR